MAVVTGYEWVAVGTWGGGLWWMLRVGDVIYTWLLESGAAILSIRSLVAGWLVLPPAQALCHLHACLQRVCEASNPNGTVRVGQCDRADKSAFNSCPDDPSSHPVRLSTPPCAQSR